jgi:hypothetical protein
LGAAIWRFPKLNVSSHPKLDHFNIKKTCFGDPPFEETTIYEYHVISLSLLGVQFPFTKVEPVSPILQRV